MKSIRCMLGIHKYKVINKEDLEIPKSNNPNVAILSIFATLPLLPFIIEHKCERCGKTDSRKYGEQ